MQLDLIDVFATGPLTGNPLAVVRGAETMSDGEMLALTRWLGYSETTFLLSPDDPAADYRRRICYPSGELPFAGHPTLGSCHAWLEAGGIPKRDGAIVQQCGAGLIEISAQGGMLHFKAPPLLRKGPLDEGATVEAARLLGISLADIIEAVHADNGPGWVLLRLRDAAALRAATIAAKPDGRADIGLFTVSEAGSQADFEVRAFFTKPDGALVEDPVTGSLNAAIAQYVLANGLATGAYRASQGHAVGADGLVYCRQEADGSIWIGGMVRSVASSALLHRPI